MAQWLGIFTESNQWSGEMSAEQRSGEVNQNA